MLTEMAGQVLHSLTKIKIESDLGMMNVKTRMSKLPFHCVVGVFPFPGAHNRGEPRGSIFIKAEHLAHFSGCGTSAIGTNVCSHRSTAFTIEFVHVLDNFLAFVSAGQVEINVRPFSALLR